MVNISILALVIIFARSDGTAFLSDVVFPVWHFQNFCYYFILSIISFPMLLLLGIFLSFPLFMLIIWFERLLYWPPTFLGMIQVLIVGKLLILQHHNGLKWPRKLLSEELPWITFPCFPISSCYTCWPCHLYQGRFLNFNLFFRGAIWSSIRTIDLVIYWL